MKLSLAVYFFWLYKGGVKLLTTAEAADVLGVSVRRVRALIAEKKLPAHRVGRDYAIEEKALRSVKIYGKPGRPKKQSNKRIGC